MHQFRVWQWNVLKLLPIRHSEPLLQPHGRCSNCTVPQSGHSTQKTIMSQYVLSVHTHYNTAQRGPKSEREGGSQTARDQFGRGNGHHHSVEMPPIDRFAGTCRLPGSPDVKWWARRDSNPGPPAREAKRPRFGPTTARHFHQPFRNTTNRWVIRAVDARMSVRALARKCAALWRAGDA